MDKSRRGTSRIRAGIWVAVGALLFSVTPLAASAAPGSNHGQGAEHRSARAEAALAAAKALFVPHEGSRASGGRRTPDASQATEVLRDLAVGLNDLDARQRQVALRILARPTDTAAEPWLGIKYHRGAHTADSCALGLATHVCVHWVTDRADGDAPPLNDANVNGVPDWVEKNQQVLEEVWQREVTGLGYRAPVDDSAVADPGPDGRLDVYLADLGQYGMYGYCAAEEPFKRSTAPAYCVLDNDFLEYPGTPLNELRVTAAHEFFHAVQYAYNVYADVWLMEGTAAWMEDEVYDSINDNLQYLWRSPLRVPGESLDYAGVYDPNNPKGNPDELNWRYGSWIWWRFLSERFGQGASEDPSVVRQVWQRLAVNGGASMPALRAVLAGRRTTFGDMFADFGAADRVAPRWYSEGRSYAKYVGAPGGAFTLSKSRRDTGWRGARLDHLSTIQAVIRPDRTLRGRWRLRVNVDLPPRYKGSEARVIVQHRDGRFTLQRIHLGRGGSGRIVTPFGSGSISRVSVSLTNASTRFTDCGRQYPFSCGGISRDDGGKYLLDARVVR